jgi:hypothetical protein
MQARDWSIQEIFTIEVAVHITCGERLLIVGLMDGFDPQIYDESVKEDNCVEFLQEKIIS